MYGPSDKSSTSSKKGGKKGSASSNSTHSANSNSDKISQKQFDRLMKRNEILEYYDFHNDQTDSENVQSVVTPIKIINNEETKNNINEEQERYSDNRNSE